MGLLSFENYSFQYALGTAPAIQDINLSIAAGEVLVVCGKSGSGKSTLLRCMKEETRPAGTVFGKRESTLLSHEITIVFQDPDTQLVNQTVMDDLVFYMENLGYDNETMKKNMAETVGFFGLESLLHRNAGTLSGGEKQLVALCAALMTGPRVLLLDEPASRLDPIASREFWDMAKHINEELGVSLIVTEHRLDQVIPFTNRIALMREGWIKYLGEPKSVFTQMHEEKTKENMRFIPDIPHLCLHIGMTHCFTPRDFRKNMTEEGFLTATPKCVETPPSRNTGPDGRREKPVIQARDIFFSYEYKPTSEFVLRNLFFDLYKGEKLCLMGGNGAGKSTLLKLLCKIIKPLSGTVLTGKNKIAYMPQDVRSFFRFETVEEELRYSRGSESGGTEGVDGSSWAEALGLSRLFGQHPLDLSGGEAQKLVLACILSGKPDIILMDEPTKGLDPCAKHEIGEILRTVPAAVMMATHDVSFAAGFAERCVMLFDGSVSFSATPRDFFRRNRYYTTSINQSVRHICPDAVTFEEALALWEDKKV